MSQPRRVPATDRLVFAGDGDRQRTVTITITATVVARDTTLHNNASVSSSTPDPNPSNNSDSAERHRAGHRRLSIHKTGEVNPTQGGNRHAYTLTVANNGPDTAHGVVVNDSLPSQFTATARRPEGSLARFPAAPAEPWPARCHACAYRQLAGLITITGTVAAGAAGQTTPTPRRSARTPTTPT